VQLKQVNDFEIVVDVGFGLVVVVRVSQNPLGQELVGEDSFRRHLEQFLSFVVFAGRQQRRRQKETVYKATNNTVIPSPVRDLRVQLFHSHQVFKYRTYCWSQRCWPQLKSHSARIGLPLTGHLLDSVTTYFQSFWGYRVFAKGYMMWKRQFR
jgi:hypothetical protein